ncbi:hypothetical protein E3Q23_02215 [Wallemia mellicola]|uniref:Uncharacterized protein n=1 Tax=Wallemia mellicola TaxID=1708541 RepID=A0A4T0LPJ9_9BASI|nr:hypothetical protein E3Q24_02255 [Wallemia mellicola]TIB75821.1 hypothetical protein E3Q23_02215 [Wallemia mellicola]TIB84165.1 hypothetical protein E3Q21_02479 [Wallemia mellicola]TIB87337.1 hypothetical protein E3Q20_02472 [Wallemia mellicola]TIC05149.1 hypothetical protein E3Q16_02400 [Wallemia mellicola]
MVFKNGHTLFYLLLAVLFASIKAIPCIESASNIVWWQTNNNNPCDLMGETAQVCNRQAAVDRLTPGGFYRADPDSCECSVPYFNLANACAYCGTGDQNRGTSKDDFFEKCEKNNIDVSPQFPENVTQANLIPPWATMAIPASGNWSFDDAEAYASENPTPTESAKPTDPSDHHYSVGAVVGGTLGGVFALALVVAIAVLIWCRRSSTAARRRRLMMRAQGIPTKVKDTDSIFEIDDEPRRDHDDLDKAYIPVPYTGSAGSQTSARQSGLWGTPSPGFAASGRFGQHSHRRSQPSSGVNPLDDENSLYSRPSVYSRPGSFAPLQSPLPAVRKGVEAGYDYFGSNKNRSSFAVNNQHVHNESDAGVSLYSDSQEDSTKQSLPPMYTDVYKRNNMI